MCNTRHGNLRIVEQSQRTYTAACHWIYTQVMLGAVRESLQLKNCIIIELVRKKKYAHSPLG